MKLKAYITTRATANLGGLDSTAAFLLLCRLLVYLGLQPHIQQTRRICMFSYNSGMFTSRTSKVNFVFMYQVFL